MEIKTREYRLPFPVHYGECVEAYGYKEACMQYAGCLYLHMDDGRMLDDYNGFSPEKLWTEQVDRCLGAPVPQDDLWENILNLNPMAERKGEVLGVTDAAALTSEGKIYLNDWSRPGFTHHWLLEEKDNHGFTNLFEWKTDPETDGSEAPVGYTFGVRGGATPVLVEYRFEGELEDACYLDIVEDILTTCRIKKVIEDGCRLFMVHTRGVVSAFCFSQEIIDEVTNWNGIVDARVFDAFVVGLTEDGRTLIAPERLGEGYYNGYDKLKDTPFKNLPSDHNGFYPPIPDDVDFRTAVQLDFHRESDTYRALMDDGSIVVATFAPGIRARIVPDFPVERLLFYEEEEFVALSADGRAAVVAWDGDRETYRTYLHFIQLPQVTPLAKVVVGHTFQFRADLHFLTRDGKLFHWCPYENKLELVRSDLADCGANDRAFGDAYFGTLTKGGRLELQTTWHTQYAPEKIDGVKRAVFAKHHVVYLKKNGTVGFMGKPRSCCKGLGAYKDVVDIDGTDDTTILRLQDGTTVSLLPRKTVTTPPPGDR